MVSIFVPQSRRRFTGERLRSGRSVEVGLLASGVAAAGADLATTWAGQRLGHGEASVLLAALFRSAPLWVGLGVLLVLRCGLLWCAWRWSVSSVPRARVAAVVVYALLGVAAWVVVVSNVLVIS